MRKRERTLLSWQYVAGFYDGEGCVLIHQKKNSRDTFIPHVSVCQAEPQQEIIYMIRDLLDSHEIKSSVSVQKPRRKNWSNLHRLTVCNQRSVATMLELMSPHMVVKREKALDVLAMTRERLEVRSQPMWRSRLHDLPEDQVREMHALWKSGVSQVRVGEMYGMSQNNVSRTFMAWAGALTDNPTLSIPQ